MALTIEYIRSLTEEELNKKKREIEQNRENAKKQLTKIQQLIDSTMAETLDEEKLEKLTPLFGFKKDLEQEIAVMNLDLELIRKVQRRDGQPSPVPPSNMYSSVTMIRASDARVQAIPGAKTYEQIRKEEEDANAKKEYEKYKEAVLRFIESEMNIVPGPTPTPTPVPNPIPTN